MSHHRKLSLTSSLLFSVVTLNLVVISGVGFGAAIWYPQERLHTLDTFLQSESEGIVLAIGAYFRPEIGTKEAIRKASESHEFSVFLSDYLSRRVNKPLPYKTTLFVIDNSQRLIAQSNRAIVLDPGIVQKPNIWVSEQRELSPESFVLSIHTPVATFRMLEMSLEVDGFQIGSIRLACLLDAITREISDFQNLLWLILIPIAILNIIGGMVLVSRALSPIGTMTQAASAISERNLGTRLPLPGGKDRFYQLALTFNLMLNRIEEAFIFQTQLVDDLSHQLRTPLTIIRGETDIALRKNRSGKEYRDILRSNLASIDRMTQFLNTMLSLARLESHVDRLQKIPANIVGMICELGNDLLPLWEEKAISLEFHVHIPHKQISARFAKPPSSLFGASVNGLLDVPVDKIRIEQAFTNILSNAWKHSPIMGKITIEVAVPAHDNPDAVSIVFSNEGPPIVEKDLTRIFERFYRSNKSENGPTVSAPWNAEESGDSQNTLYLPGFGLGLSIAKSIVTMHGGNIRAFNLPRGGAAFEILLPRT